MIKHEPAAVVTLRDGSTHAAIFALDVFTLPVRVLACDQARAYPVGDVVIAPLVARRIGCRTCQKWRRAYLNNQRQIKMPWGDE